MENEATQARVEHQSNSMTTGSTERRSVRSFAAARRLVVAALIAVIAVLGTTTSAQATAAPEFIYHWNTSSRVIVVESSGHLAGRWAVQQVVRDWNAADVLVVHQGLCSAFPAQHCVKVRQYRDTTVGAPVGYAIGQGGTDGTDQTVLISLNMAYQGWTNVDPRAVACHEMGHAVGFTHDERSGCTSEEGRETPSRWELNRAAAAYRTGTPARATATVDADRG